MAAAMLGELTIDGKTYALDDLTLGELEALEDHMGLPIGQIDLNSARAMRFLVWLLKHRENPAFTMEQAGDVKITDLIQPEDDNPPADAGAEDAPANDATAG
jgi:hypothetical protein